MAEIVECRDFCCEHNKNNKCTLDKVMMVVIENELFCQDAERPIKTGTTVYIYDEDYDE